MAERQPICNAVGCTPLFPYQSFCQENVKFPAVCCSAQKVEFCKWGAFLWASPPPEVELFALKIESAKDTAVLREKF